METLLEHNQLAYSFLSYLLKHLQAKTYLSARDKEINNNKNPYLPGNELKL